MLVEKQLSEALKDYDQGKKVIVMTVMCDGSMSCDLLEDLFGNTETHFLVDVPAYRNPEFEAAVHAMTSKEAKCEQKRTDSSEAENLSGGG